MRVGLFMEKQLWSHWSQLLSLRHKESESPGPVGGWCFIMQHLDHLVDIRGALCSLLTWGSTCFHDFKGLLSADSGQSHTRKTEQWGNFTKLNPNCWCAKVRGLDAHFPHQRMSRLSPERILQTLPNRKEYTGRVLIKPSTLKCLRNFPKTQLEIWRNQSIILILVFRGYINNARVWVCGNDQKNWREVNPIEGKVQRLQWPSII